jgi:2-amino-4-hydroxy-6-hydroxymethyldihydropteridine diphosphokinase
MIHDIILSTGSNLGERYLNITQAKMILQEHFNLVEESKVYESKAVDYLNQPDFLNQVLHFKVPQQQFDNPCALVELFLSIEKEMGRTRIIDKGPRIIDIDLLFVDALIYSGPRASIPHPRVFQRSFIVKPLQDLDIFKKLKTHFVFPKDLLQKTWIYNHDLR